MNPFNAAVTEAVITLVYMYCYFKRLVFFWEKNYCAKREKRIKGTSEKLLVSDEKLFCTQNDNDYRHVHGNND